MKLMVKMLLLAAASLALAAIHHDDAQPETAPAVTEAAVWQPGTFPENFVPRHGSWANVFGASWR